MAKLAGGHSQGETVVKSFLRQLRRGQAEKNVDKQGTCYNTFAAVRENERQDDPNYGRPDSGSLSAMRAAAGEAKMRSDICDVCDVIFQVA